ncbi:hypothetical protein Y032_0009g685 [Ancylostoma ceylanicum]|uniref:Uncharacterized protein n=1 Tax=Ancylostoma ceylanicum TaxID=53326 RepID=A0A016VJA5_9BILA|nr:hypothetical protein Y032_0009g685 [Ancylostoma ceylanicum]
MSLLPNSMNEAVEGELRVSMFSHLESLHFLVIVLFPHLPRLLSSSSSASIVKSECVASSRTLSKVSAILRSWLFALVTSPLPNLTSRSATTRE